MYLSDLTKAELQSLLAEWGEPRYRADQVYAWLSRCAPVAEMTNIPKPLREKLAAIPYGAVSIAQKYVSPKDGTIKYLFQLDDQNLVEGVLMRYHYGNTLCLSTQVGCRMGCAFCASTLGGLLRNLRPGEILGQLAAVMRDQPAADSGQRSVTNLVLMGSGEPLDNYDHVLLFLQAVTSAEGMHFSPRNISVSTCGIVPMMERFMREAPHVTLSVSLHAPSDEQRNALMPVNRRYPIAEVLDAARRYADTTGRRVVFEYVLIRGHNADKSDALALAGRLKGILCHVNLIPLNAVPERGLVGATRAEAEQFCIWLQEAHISATVRREMGTDIEGACGQLRRRVIHEVRE